MKVRYSATLEFDIAPPLTHKGELEANGLQTIYHRAAKELKKTYPNKTWRSVVIVIERI